MLLRLETKLITKTNMKQQMKVLCGELTTNLDQLLAANGLRFGKVQQRLYSARVVRSKADDGARKKGPMDSYRVSQTTYAKDFEWAKNDPVGFWASQAQHLDWHTPWDSVLDQRQAPFNKWFAGGKLNVSHNALDRHVDGGLADRTAIIYDSPITNIVTKLTYAQLRDRVSGTTD